MLGLQCWLVQLLLLADSESLHDLPVEIAVVVRAAQVGDPPVVVVTEVRGAAGADGAQIVVPLLSPEVPGQLPRLQGTRLSPLSALQGAPAQVEVLPCSHHLPATSRGVILLIIIIISCGDLEYLEKGAIVVSLAQCYGVVKYVT